MVAVTGQQPLLDALAHRRGAQPDEYSRAAPGRAGRLEVGGQTRRIGHGFELPAAGRGPKIERCARTDPQRLASKFNHDGALSIGIADRDLALLQDEFVVGS